MEATMEEKNEQDIEAKRAEAAEELRAAFAELESDEGLTRFIGGHGVQSRIFEFEWSEPALEISFHICRRTRHPEPRVRVRVERACA